MKRFTNEKPTVVALAALMSAFEIGTPAMFEYPSMSASEKATISRGKGMMGASQTYAGARHALKIFKNDDGMARLYYKFSGSIQFMKNMK